ncbi:permease prefix domain 1-containing protein [Streptomyces zhihengii]|uniref:permease prefix domain 1-containing protein n=1 Tax=Streptomyces zhihengii TaxID=1818004 RepID=UPI003451D459
MSGAAARLVEGHVAALAEGLHGPARARARLLREAHDGLSDAVADLVGRGVPEGRAAERAVRDFGTPDEVRPAFQAELTLAQARGTSRLLALVLPALIACWYLAAAVAPAPGDAAALLAGLLGAVAVGGTLLAAGAAAMTGALGRVVPAPARLPEAVAWTATCMSVALAVGALSLTAVWTASGDWAAAGAAGALTLLSHARVGSSARACRRCLGGAGR